MHIGGKGEGDGDGALYCSSGDPKGTGGERKATLHCSKVDNLVVRKSPLRGPDAPTPALGEEL